MAHMQHRSYLGVVKGRFMCARCNLTVALTYCNSIGHRLNLSLCKHVACHLFAYGLWANMMNDERTEIIL